MISDDSRLSVWPTNVNQQNFAIDDILGVVGAVDNSGGARHRSGRDMANFMVGNQSGISKVYSLGVNYSDEWGKKVNLTVATFSIRQTLTRSLKQIGITI